MRILTTVSVSVAFALLPGTARSRTSACDAVGNVLFICDQVGPEDLAPVPGSRWVLASGQVANGAIRLISVHDRSTSVLFPTATPRQRLDTKTYPLCPGPIDPAEKEKFRAHGLYLRQGEHGVHTLYVVHHGNRESVEVFEVDGRSTPPTLSWIGCAVAPEKVSLNAVVGLADGGFAATNIQTIGTERGRLQAGEITGEVWEWHTGTGWKIVPGSEASGPNGLEISKDGKWFYIGGWGSQSFIRLSRGQTPVKKDAVPVGFHLDNLRWAPDGSLFAAGQGGTAAAGLSYVAKVNPNTLKVQEIVRYPYNEVFSVGTVAIQVGKEIWVGSTRGDRIALFPATESKQAR